MNTVQKNNTITKKQVQELLEKNQEKLGLSDKNINKLIKSVRSNNISRQMRKVFYQECLKKIERNEELLEGKFSHIMPEDRISIEILYTAGFNNAFIGAFVNKNRSSIKREIDKNTIEIWDINSTKSPYKEKKQINIKYYSAERAQKNATENKLKNRKRCKLDRYKNLRWSVVALLKEKTMDYSPDIISNFSKEGKIKDAETSISTNSIYRAVKARKYGLTINDLPHGRGYFKKGGNNPHTQTKEISERKKEISIEVMPEEIKRKEVDTHFEGDSVVGVAKGTHQTLITLANPVSQFVFIRRSENKTGTATVNTIDKLEEEIPNLKEIITSILFDNGVEFSKFDEMMKSVKNRDEKRFQIYFTHPYASYERGCNENKNRMIRRYFKKGKLVENLSDEDILNIERKINNMPRKALGYRTPLEVFESNLKKKSIDTGFLDKYRIKLPKCLVA
jgi:IS30 family transposase